MVLPFPSTQRLHPSCFQVSSLGFITWFQPLPGDTPGISPISGSILTGLKERMGFSCLVTVKECQQTHVLSVTGQIVVSAQPLLQAHPH